MLSCREMTELASSFHEGTLGFGQRLKFRLHLAMCDACRRYLRQLEATIGALRQSAPATEPAPAAVDAAAQAFREWKKKSS